VKAQTANPAVIVGLILVPVAIVCVAVLGPVPVLLALMAALAIGTAFVAPKLTVGLAMILMLLGRTFEAHISVAGYLDEALVLLLGVVLPLRRVIGGQKLRSITGQMGFLLFGAVGLLSAAVAAVPIGIAFQGAILILKGVILGWAIAQVDWNRRDLAHIARWGAAATSVLLAGAAVNLAVPSIWNSVVIPGASWGFRYGLQPITSFFVHPGYFGTSLALAGIAVLAYQLCFKATPFSRALLIGTVIGAVLTFRRKVLIGMIAGGGLLWLRVHPAKVIATAVVAIPIVLILTAEAITETLRFTYAEYLVNPDAVARIRLIFDAPAVALAHFPFGAGFGRFGSAIARQNYSPEYYDLGYPQVWGLGPTAENGKFLTDTFWPAIVGEAGFLGFIFYAGGIVAIGVMFLRMTRREAQDPWVKWLSLVGLGWTVELVIESMAGPIFMAVPTFALFFFVVGVAAAFREEDPCPAELRRNRTRSRARIHE
jgi:hypothetical protein